MSRHIIMVDKLISAKGVNAASPHWPASLTLGLQKQQRNQALERKCFDVEILTEAHISEYSVNDSYYCTVNDLYIVLS